MFAVMLLALKLLTFPALAADDLSAYTIYYEKEVQIGNTQYRFHLHFTIFW